MGSTTKSISVHKTGNNSKILQSILERLGLTETDWLDNTQHFEARFRRQFSWQKPLPQSG